MDWGVELMARKAKVALVYRFVGFFVSTAGILLHFMADNVVETGFMVRHKLAYFTIQTNILAALLFAVLLLQAIQQHRKDGVWRVGTVPPGVHGALTFYITMTMLGFWGILAPTTGLPSNNFLLMNTLILHLMSPLLTMVDFMLFCPHGHLRKRHAALWLCYPVVYVFFVVGYSKCIQEPYYSFQMGNRTIDLMYPYPFLDANVMSGWGVVGAVLLIAAVFYTVARLLVFADRRLEKSRKLLLKNA